MSALAICLTHTRGSRIFYTPGLVWKVDGFVFSFSGPPAPYQPQGWGNGYPHWQQGQPDPSEYHQFTLLISLTEL